MRQSVRASFSGLLALRADCTVRELAKRNGFL